MVQAEVSLSSTRTALESSDKRNNPQRVLVQSWSSVSRRQNEGPLYAGEVRSGSERRTQEVVVHKPGGTHPDRQHRQRQARAEGLGVDDLGIVDRRQGLRVEGSMQGVAEARGVALAAFPGLPSRSQGAAERERGRPFPG